MYQAPLSIPIQSNGVTTTLVTNNAGNNHNIVPFSSNIGGMAIGRGYGDVRGGYAIHPDVRIKKLAFYDNLATLIQPSTLIPSTTQRTQEATFCFTLTPQQATEIAVNRDIRSQKIEHVIQVQLRFCCLDQTCEQDDCFPPGVVVKMNNKLCPLPTPIPTNRPNVEPKRPPRPVNITTNVKLSPTVTNNITVQWINDFSRDYVLSVYLVKKLTSLQLLQRLKVKGIKSMEYTRSLIKEKLTEDADCEIATTLLKVSLICPLGKMRMSIPCRALTCSHLQCFDASLFLQMNERKPTWSCPVCNKPATYDTLVIDGYFQEVLASPLLTDSDTEIQLNKDGSWSTHVAENDNESDLKEINQSSKDEVLVIPDDAECTQEEKISPLKIGLSTIPLSTTSLLLSSIPNKAKLENESAAATNSVVDLTQSDSEDDAPLAQRKSITPSKTSSNKVQPAKVSAGNDSSYILLDSPSPPPPPCN